MYICAAYIVGYNVSIYTATTKNFQRKKPISTKSTVFENYARLSIVSLWPYHVKTTEQISNGLP